MIISNISPQQLDAAIRATNRTHGYKLIWNREPEFNAKKTRAICTIRSRFSNIKGARRSWSGRNIPAASWHAHGHFYEQVFAYSPNAIIRVRGDVKITKNSGNWQDWNCGPEARPAYMSELSVGE